MCAEFTVRARAADRAEDVPPPDLAIFAVKAYSNAERSRCSPAWCAATRVVLTLQNGVDSVDEIARFVTASQVLGGSTYVAAALAAPGLVEQTGTHQPHRLWRGGWPRARVSRPRGAAAPGLCRRGHRVRARGGRPGPDLGKVLLSGAVCRFHWRRTAADRPALVRRERRAGPWWRPSRKSPPSAAGRRHLIARRLGRRNRGYLDRSRPRPARRCSSTCNRASRSRYRGARRTVVRRAARLGVPAPILSALYAVLRPHANGPSPY